MNVPVSLTCFFVFAFFLRAIAVHPGSRIDNPVFQIDVRSLRPANEAGINAAKDAITLQDDTNVQDRSPSSSVREGIIGMVYLSITSKANLAMLPIYDSLDSARGYLSSHFVKICRSSEASSSTSQQECFLQPVILEPTAQQSNQSNGSWFWSCFQRLRELIFGDTRPLSIPVVLQILSSKLIEATVVEPMAQALTENQPIEQKLLMADGLNKAVKGFTFVTANLIKRASSLPRQQSIGKAKHELLTRQQSIGKDKQE